jgi:hypothetical protein
MRWRDVGHPEKLLNLLSKQLLLGKVQPKSRVMLDMFDGMVVFRAQKEVEVEVVSEN